MAIEILGLPLNPESRVGDIVAAIGLIASAIIFYIGYRRTTRMEQFKLWNEIFHRMDEKNKDRISYGKAKIDVDDWSTLSGKEQKERLEGFSDRLRFLKNELAILTTLWYEGDVPSWLMDPQIKNTLLIIEEVIDNYNGVKDEPALKEKEEDIKDAIADLQNLKIALQKGRTSRLEESIGRLKEVLHIG